MKSLTKGIANGNYHSDTMSDEQKGKVVPLRITATKLQARVREAASQSSNVRFVPDIGTDSYGELLTFRQALMCLQKGKIVGKPTMNEHGDWMFRMERFSANQTVTFLVAATCVGARVERLTVLRDKV